MPVCQCAEPMRIFFLLRQCCIRPNDRALCWKKDRKRNTKTEIVCHMTASSQHSSNSMQSYVRRTYTQTHIQYNKNEWLRMYVSTTIWTVSTNKAKSNSSTQCSFFLLSHVCKWRRTKISVHTMFRHYQQLNLWNNHDLTRFFPWFKYKFWLFELNRILLINRTFGLFEFSLKRLYVTQWVWNGF